MKKNFRLLIVTLFSTLALGAMGQVNPTDSTHRNNSFDRFRQQVNDEFDLFRLQAQEEFNRFLAEAWTEYECFIGESGIYSNPKPSQLVSPSTKAGKSSTATSSYQVQTIPETQRRDAIDPIPVESGMESIRFYGRTLHFHFPEVLRTTAKSIKESDVAKYYKTMSLCNEGKLLHRELTLTVKRLGLNPWGYYLLVRSLAEKAFANNNDRVLFCFYMLHSNGFMARVGRGLKSKQLILLLAIDNKKEVYSLPFFRINGVKYYSVYGGELGEDAYSYNEKADESHLKQVGLDFRNILNLSPCDKERVLQLTLANLKLTLPYSTSNLRYYDDIPLTVFPVYFKCGMNPEAQEALSTTMAELSKRYDKKQLVGILLDFVQNAFAYKIDEDQFGHEKYFYPEEVIGYPYSDCEDRCALFAWLVRKYVGYDVVGILYPDHLATAVCIGEEQLLCDPTYPGAPMGKVYPKYEGKSFEVIPIP